MLKYPVTGLLFSVIETNNEAVDIFPGGGVTLVASRRLLTIKVTVTAPPTKTNTAVISSITRDLLLNKCCLNIIYNSPLKMGLLLCNYLEHPQTCPVDGYEYL